MLPCLSVTLKVSTILLFILVCSNFPNTYSALPYRNYVDESTGLFQNSMVAPNRMKTNREGQGHRWPKIIISLGKRSQVDSIPMDYFERAAKSGRQIGVRLG